MELNTDEKFYCILGCGDIKIPINKHRTFGRFCCLHLQNRNGSRSHCL